jgi:hypothetical protein
VRRSHWLNVPILLGLILSGISIYWSSPIYQHKPDPITGNFDVAADIGIWLCAQGRAIVLLRVWEMSGISIGKERWNRLDGAGRLFLESNHGRGPAAMLLAGIAAIPMEHRNSLASVAEVARRVLMANTDQFLPIGALFEYLSAWAGTCS